MAYYININGQVKEVSEQAYRAYNLGTPSNPAGGGDVTQLNNTQTILNPNTTNNIPGNQLPTAAENIASLNAAGFGAPAPTAADQANIDAINRIDRNRSQVGSESFPTPAENLASLNAAGFGPAPVTAEDQANIDAINRIESKRAGNVDPTSDPAADALRAAAAEADTVVAENNQTVDDADPFEAARLRAIEEEDTEPRVFTAEDLGVEEQGFFGGLFDSAKQTINRATLRSEDSLDAASQAATLLKAKQQATLAARYKSPANGDWRVRLTLAEDANYLYKANPPGILKPLAQTNGVIFPYTPQIQTAYTANYEQYDLVHSNYRGYFYKNSKVGDITINAVFTAQNTQEAEYLLAVIHFFRSVTKMFYGQDAQRGAPPPLVYLLGFGDFQFKGHPCLISNFQYSLPNDVDYIRANNPNNYGTNMLNRVSATNSTSSVIPASVNRLANAIDNFGRSLLPGALSGLPSPGSVVSTVDNLNNSTYVPTKMEINLTLLPVQTRAQVSKQFSLKGFANGDLLKGGFW